MSNSTSLAESSAAWLSSLDQGTCIFRVQLTECVDRYEEDVFINNHTSVWGSWWSNGQWGYACCHQFVRNSYCTGEKGKEIAAAESQVLEPVTEFPAPEPRTEKHSASNLDLWGNDATDKDLDPDLVAKARRKLHLKRKLEDVDDKDRTYNSISGSIDDVTQADIEAYRMEKHHASDPLKAIEAKHGQKSKDYDFV